MIDGIRENNNAINEYYKRDKVAKANENVPKFLLGDEEEGVVWERSSEQKGKKTPSRIPSGGVTNTTFSKEKVTYTPSKEAKELIAQENVAPKEKSVENADEKKQGPLQRVLQGIKGFFGKIMQFLWYGDDKKKEDVQRDEKNLSKTQVSSISEDVSAATLKETDEERIKAYIKEGNTDGVMQVLTRGGTVLPARNTSLLTQYDRRGHITTAKGVNTGVILHGDKPMNL